MNKEQVIEFTKRLEDRFKDLPEQEFAFMTREEWETLKTIIDNYQETIKTITTMMDDHMETHKKEESFWSRMKSEIA